MTPEELDEARAKEARRQWGSKNWSPDDVSAVANIAARLAREGWTPPKPVDPDLLAFREWVAGQWPPAANYLYQRGLADNGREARAFLAGAHMATERERERSKTLGEGVRPLFLRLLELAAINDFDETVADGGITSGMVCRQEITLIADALILLFSENDKADQ